MTVILTLVGIIAFFITLVFTKLNFKKSFGVLFAFILTGILVDVFLATFAITMFNYPY